MEEQKGADDTEQQRKVQFDDSEQKEKPTNQSRDDKQHHKHHDEEDEDETLGVTDERKVSRQEDATVVHGNSSSRQHTQTDDRSNIQQNNTTNNEVQFEDTERRTSKTDEEKANERRAEQSAGNGQVEQNNVEQRQTSYSLSSREVSKKDSIGNSGEPPESNIDKTEDTSPNYETDDVKISKRTDTSQTRSTKSNNSGKFINWEDEKSDENAISQEVNTQVKKDKEAEKTKEKSNTSKSNNKEKSDDVKTTSHSTETKTKTDVSPNEINTVTLVTKRQSITKQQQQQQKQQQQQTQKQQITQQQKQPPAQDRRQISKSATYASRGGKQQSRPVTSSTIASSRASTARSYRPPSRPRTVLGYSPETRRERDFFHKELQRLKDSLRKESKSIKKPKVRDHYPDVFTSLAPYYNTYTANYLINMPDLGYKEKQPAQVKKEEEHEKDIMYTTRRTAIGLCDPWDSLNMDKSVLPKLETAEIRKKRIEQMHAFESNKPKSARASSNTDRNAQSGHGSPRQDSQKQKRPEAKQGSTRLPKFPVIVPPNSDLATKELHYGDVPMLRDELIRSFSHFGEDRKKSDYTRTRQDFFRMELDRLDEYHETTRPHMRAAYFAYLQNTPGSRKAIYDCMKEMGKPKKDKEPTAQAVA